MKKTFANWQPILMAHNQQWQRNGWYVGPSDKYMPVHTIICYKGCRLQAI